MQFVYTNYVYINTRDIKGNMMFAFGPYIPTYSCCSNPFGPTIANPRINFALGIAAATAMPMMPIYRPCMPIFGFGFGGYNYGYNFQNFAYAQTPTFGALTGQNFLGYFNRIPNIPLNTDTYLNSYTNNSYSSNNPFGYFNNFNNIKITPISGGTISVNNNTTNTKKETKEVEETEQTEEVTDIDNTEIATNGTTLNRNNNDYGPEFLAKVKQIAARLDCNYRDLLGLMNSESGINASAKNPNGSATGLIQFIESTAQSLGTSTAELRNMKPIDQLDYVEKYLAQAKANAGITGKLSAGDLYALTFLPGRASRQVLTSSGENYYAHNKGLDLNNDGQITKNELGQRIQNKYVSDNSFLA